MISRALQAQLRTQDRDGYSHRWRLSQQVREAEERGDIDEARRLLKQVYADARREAAR